MFDPQDLSVGIDLGTTFSVVAYLDRDLKPVTVPNDEGDLSTPSVVYFDTHGTVVGNEAINASEYEPERAARYAKRDIGHNVFHKKILGRSIPPEVIQAIILDKLKDDAELKIGEFFEAVITVPAYFNEPRRKATQDAGQLAGIEVLDIINEPTAAAIAFGVKEGFVDHEGKSVKHERVLVYDLGGGTFDVTLMDLKGPRFDTIATAGDVHLGGIDWDLRVLDFLADQFESEYGIDPREDPAAFQKLCVLASRAKKTLSSRESAQVRFSHASKSSSLEIDRKQFEALTEDLVERTKMTVNRLLRDAGMKWSDLSRLLLVGGSTRMPMIPQMLETMSGMPPDRSLSPDEAVAHGAAVYANILKRRGDANNGFSISNVNSHDLGVLGIDPKTKKPGRKIMIPRNSKLPAVQSKKFVTSKDSQKEVMIKVVEGGTDAGVGATEIGKCRVTGLPKGLKKGSLVNVTFKYSADGRLTVSAELPAAEVRARTTIERAAGMSESELAKWTVKIRNGILIDQESVDTGDQVRSSNVAAKPKAPKQTLPTGARVKNNKKGKPKKLPKTPPGKTNRKSASNENANDGISALGQESKVEKDSSLDSFFGKLE